MRIAVIGDIHANASALAATLAAVRRQGCDHCVLLGDLLTYGVDVEETLGQVTEWLQDPRHVLIRGNHDQMYGELLAGHSPYYDHLPDWIRESVDWTLERLSGAQWDGLPFVDEWRIAGGLFSHANPFGPGNWRYLNQLADYQEAGQTLSAGQLGFGVFGHSHRARIWPGQGPLLDWSLATHTSIHIPAGRNPAVVNAGSPGQPREAACCPPLLLWLEIDALGMSARFEALPHDEQEHARRVLDAGLSSKLLTRLGTYHPGLAAAARSPAAH